MRSTLGVDADGEGHTAQLLMELDIEYYQGPEEFSPIETTQLTGVDITITMPDGTPKPGISFNIQE
ncbi:hypothetical protein D3C77_782280 [compost metagenome]